MKEITEDDVKKLIQKGAKSLSNICLLNDMHQEYTDEDLVNATLIFTHFWLDVIYSNSKHLPQEAVLELAETSGKALSELIRVSTGKDMHKLVTK